MDTLAPLLKDFTNLREWTIESPYSNWGNWQMDVAVSWIKEDLAEFYRILELASPLASIAEQPKVLPLLQSCES